MTTKRIAYLILTLLIFGATTNIGFAADSAIRYPIADFETGVDPRWGQSSPAPLVITHPSFAWTPNQPDNINYWDVTSDRDDQNEYADQILNTTALDLSRYDRITLTFYTNIYNGSQVTSEKGKIQVIIHDTSYGDVVIGTLVNGAAQHDIHRMSLSGLPAAAKDQIDQIRFRIYEDYFGAVAAPGQTQPSTRMQRTHLYTIGAEIGSDMPHMTLADFEKGVDPRGVLYASGLTTQGPHYAWAPAQTDNINFWDVISDNDGQNDFADYHLVLVPQNWQPYTQLRIKFYTTCTTSCDGKITPIIHDTDGGYTILGTFSASQRDAQNWITIPLTGVANRDQIDDLTLRVHESYFGGTNINGASQRTHVYDIELTNTASYPKLSISGGQSESNAFSRPSNYDYAPSIMKDGNIYKMWWCSSTVSPVSNANTVWDGIFYAESTDGTNWTVNSNPVLKVMEYSPETNGAKQGHACDPSVVKVNGTYYMYYDAAGPTKDQCDYFKNNPQLNLTKCPTGYIQYNQIYLATSTNGINWTKRLNPTTGKPQPVIANTYSPPTLYGIGQPTALYLNGRFHLYYTDSANWQSTRLKISHNGIFDDSDVGYQVYSDMDLVPTYHKDYGTFIGMSAHDLNGSPGTQDKNPLYVLQSRNGVRWTNDYQLSSEMINVNPNVGTNIIHNPGILTDPHGLTSGNTLRVYYGGGPDVFPSWEIMYTDLSLTPSP